MTARKETDIFSCVALIIIRQLGNLQSKILFGRIDMISLSIIIRKQGHIAGHLSVLQVTMYKKPFLDCFSPLRSPPFLIFIPIPFHISVRQRHIHRKYSGINTHGTDKAIRPRRSIAYRHTNTGRFIPPTLQFKMKPQNKFSGLLIVYHLRTLHNTTFPYLIFRFG